MDTQNKRNEKTFLNLQNFMKINIKNYVNIKKNWLQSLAIACMPKSHTIIFIALCNKNTWLMTSLFFYIWPTC